MKIKKENYLKKFSIEKYKSSAEKELAKEIWKYLGKKLSFGAIMRIIKTKGYRAIFLIFQELKKGFAKNKASLFLWLVKNEKIIFKDEEK